MRVISGVEAALDVLRPSPSLELEVAPPGVEVRIRELFGEPLSVRQAVERILADVRARGDAALREYGRRLDGVEMDTLEVGQALRGEAHSRVPSELKEALEVAAERVREYHRASLRRTWVDVEEGWGELVTPLERVGIYIPGGTASYPSSVLMTAIPAKIAGVGEVIITTPPQGAQGPAPAVLVAADIAGVDRVFQIGGAQAIAALAYGTSSVPRVDKVCGPGNVFVTLAKKLVYGVVDVDGLYGPTETVVVADDSADPALCAADLLAQAEHDPLASPIFVTPSQDLLQAVQRQVERQLSTLERRDIARQALEGQGALVLVRDLEEAFRLANAYAPEHLCLLVREPWSHLEKVRHAGGVFLGDTSPEVVGDYVAGPSHQMPTSGTARFSSVLGVHHFLKVTAVVGLPERTFHRLAGAAETIARAEGFTGHARALAARRRPSEELQG